MLWPGNRSTAILISPIYDQRKSDAPFQLVNQIRKVLLLQIVAFFHTSKCLSADLSMLVLINELHLRYSFIRLE